MADINETNTNSVHKLLTNIFLLSLIAIFLSIANIVGVGSFAMFNRVEDQDSLVSKSVSGPYSVSFVPSFVDVNPDEEFVLTLKIEGKDIHKLSTFETKLNFDPDILKITKVGLLDEGETSDKYETASWDMETGKFAFFVDPKVLGADSEETGFLSQKDGAILLQVHMVGLKSRSATMVTLDPETRGYIYKQGAINPSFSYASIFVK